MSTDRFADVWGVREIVAAVVVLAGAAVALLGQWLDSSPLIVAGGIVVLVGLAVFVVGRVAGGSDRSSHDDWV